ncbi:hypothetical protein QEG98_26290 [Myxococcus sp. MxC21-1]|uniref:hypothetical protein n=1 Tax=Myxococcus sp. MxC21-1 TaxID=3041439 RepID=UPI00292DE264|nr:hypothetical protein [Myxococcus sp. MxC21-1]WNZ59554.1 hypothetical protein QEG98_26290 [Myxococcus sp. MxC21-1]
MVSNRAAETAMRGQEEQLDSIADVLRELRFELERLDGTIQDQRKLVSQVSDVNAQEQSGGGTELLRDVPENGGSAQAEVAVEDGASKGHENA